ncbi:Non-specific lipid-transfer protein [Melia azedarach]|uniref:Non-specific lipid-transfer protein n=1 Tax=Melia azedarach TaxID=155640 RepID=A0ACC1XIM1_MELAZ|nr:Non-specific lipid-transfer protein [Melia azedarach]
MKGAIISVLVLVATVQMLVKPGEAVTCGQVDASLAPCIPYLTAGGSPAAACCDGVKNLQTITPTTADRRAAWDCVNDAAARYPSVNEEAASSLLQKCGVQMDIPISKTTNCAK